MTQRQYQALLKTMIQLKVTCLYQRKSLSKRYLVNRFGDEEVFLGLWLDASQRDASGADEA